ncbi:MAG: glycosyltransferase family 39 protein [Elusimicrobia bacterium]|nr:glycosyltransferase family 39 protein [Elusimicrobiota bacterium]
MKYSSALLLAGACLLALPSLVAPVFLWEWINHAAALSILDGGAPKIALWQDRPLLIHPPSVAYLLAAAIRLFGDSAWAMRLPGLCLHLAHGFLIHRLVLAMGRGSSQGWWAAALYWSNPLAIQGMLCIDFADGSLLSIAVTAFLWLLFAGRSQSFWPRSLALGFCLGFVLWTKLTTPLALLGAFTLTCARGRKPEGNPRLFLAATAVGAAFFIGTWALYCGWIQRSLGLQQSVMRLMLEPLYYATGGGAGQAAWNASLMTILGTWLAFFLYAGPGLVGVGALEGAQWVKQAWRDRRFPPHSTLTLFAVTVVLTYCLFFGGARAYPKYFQPALAPLCVMGVFFLFQKEFQESWRPSWRWAIIFASCAAYYGLVVGDYVYIFNYKLREGQYLGRMIPQGLSLLLKLCLYSLPAGFLWVFGRGTRHRWAALLLASQVGLAAAQGWARYDLRAAYGTPWSAIRRVETALREQPAGGPALADFAILQATGVEPVRGFRPSDWDDLRKIAKLIRDEKPRAVVYGLSVNTVAQLRAIDADQELQELLSSRYTLYRIEPFRAWLRREEMAHD